MAGVVWNPTRRPTNSPTGQPTAPATPVDKPSADAINDLRYEVRRPGIPQDIYDQIKVGYDVKVPGASDPMIKGVMDQMRSAGLKEGQQQAAGITRQVGAAGSAGQRALAQLTGASMGEQNANQAGIGYQKFLTDVATGNADRKQSGMLGLIGAKLEERGQNLEGYSDIISAIQGGRELDQNMQARLLELIAALS